MVRFLADRSNCCDLLGLGGCLISHWCAVSAGVVFRDPNYRRDLRYEISPLSQVAFSLCLSSCNMN
jgi:hypothetical protein